MNGDEIIAWAKTQGMKTIPVSELHTTIAYSKEMLDWDKLTPNLNTVTVVGGKRDVMQLGEAGAVLKYNSTVLHTRWQQILDAGASYDFPQYIPHISITYDKLDLDLTHVKPYNGKIVLGPEVFEELDLNWKEKVKED